MAEKPDVVVVGLGSSGGVIAAELAKAGAKVVALEKGPHYTDDDFRFKQDEIRYYVRFGISPGMRSDPITWRANDQIEAVVLPWGGPLTFGPLFLPPSIGTGGGSIHWAGWAWRFRPEELRMRTAIVERFGEAALGDESTMVDWPITYDLLEPYYDRVEWELGVSGLAGNIAGEIKPGGNPFEAPRRREYPMPPVRAAAGDERFVAACKKLGYHPFPAPLAVASRDFNGRSGCVYCGFCRDYPCHVGAKTSTQVATLPAALATGNLEIRALSRVFQVMPDAAGKGIKGVRYFDADGREREIEAGMVVLACYALENARLMLASGLNANGQVGMHYMTHNYGWFTGTLPEWTNPFMGPAGAASAIDDLTSERVPANEDGVVWGSPIIGFAGDIQPIEATRLMPTEGPRWGKPFKEWMRNNYRRMFNMYSQHATFPSKRFYCDLDPRVKDPFGQPALRITHDWQIHDILAAEQNTRVKRDIGQEMGMLESWAAPPGMPFHVTSHEVGTHRMGDDPSTSVVDRFGESHEVKNLFVTGGGQLPSHGGYNPTETIMALAFMTSERMLEKLGGRKQTATP